MDTVADMLTIIRNGQLAGKEAVKIPYSNFKFELARFLENLGFLAKVEKAGKKEKRYLEIVLKYGEDKRGIIAKIQRVSKPSHKTYGGYTKLRWPSGSILIVSTSKGLMTADQAKKSKLGGELICLIS